ncbi:MAG TPA: tRNA lysidine(34) synthetase TilS [Brevibacterium senegalense]|uniref:tRNA(Ile)-lysidine synthase n=1 Tax=Brevibacterium senegalense TaxID=1033736 RepID=A0A921MCN3_9MICO|nr:tRNA lysidine(34) synthetase TilS [Brevibacterium senegalense]
MSADPARRPRLDPATARIRTALRAALQASRAVSRPASDPASQQDGSSLHDVAKEERAARLLVAVSGGADSLALAAAAAFLHSRGEARFLAVTVDHGLQEGSDAVARDTVAALDAMGLPARSVTADVDPEYPGGLEAAARTARYTALARAAATAGAAAVLTGHTQDDQAETVLLGLLRGSGARSLSGMAAQTRLDTDAGPLTVLRPLLGLTREQTRASVRAQDLTAWDDPMNEDPRFTRVRARRILRDLAESLGQDLRAGLARTADLLREDADHLDAEAGRAWTALIAEDRGETAPPSLPIASLVELGPAVAGRVVRTWLLARGVPASDLTADHVRDVGEVAAASGAEKREASVPGAGTVRRVRGMLVHRRD